MDLDGDGHTDILSGSYSRQDRDMAGLFQVLRGTADGGFAKATVLDGTDGEPLIITCDEADVTGRICTRPTAVDLDGDGHLDLVVGNFSGTFAWFRGEGKGRFRPESTWLPCGDAPLRVGHHGDPFFVDWDRDGDLDLVSGANDGGVTLFVNSGSETSPEFAAGTELVPAFRAAADDGMRFGDAHLDRPQRATRVWVADVDGDDDLDLLVGDQVTLYAPANGLSEAAVRERDAKWQQERQRLVDAIQAAGVDAAAQRAANERLREHYAARAEFLTTDSTGFVWLYRRR